LMFMLLTRDLLLQASFVTESDREAGVRFALGCISAPC